MNIFRFAGVSLRTQELYAVVFIWRYLDLLTSFVSLYNTCMKLIFIGATLAIIYQMRNDRVLKATYDKDRDTFRTWTLILGSIVAAFLFHERIRGRGGLHYIMEILWQASIYLEAVAIFPQLVLIQRTQNIDNLTGNYVFLLGSYRALYILNWIYRYFTEPRYIHWLMWLAGLVQTVLYVDFFYYYIRSWKNNQKLVLPA